VTETVYTPQAVAEVRGHAATFRSLLASDDLEPDRREALTECLADADAWLEEAAHRG
jgi:ATP phosphoribosyltransferase regulatory subunit HisZ